MDIVTHQHRSAKLKLTSLLILALLLFSAVSHSHDLSVESSHSLEQLDCKLCQQLVEPPKQKIKLAKITLGYFSANNESLVNNYLVSNQYPTTKPRAPPSVT